ncbi:hypothetical protein EJ419_05485 [Alloscardovia theropitheci]|uniref:Uncharacterized protein n=1 Tax=Alloscardovia theropitheci TaxID=2496842 RepID=A0A4R0QVC0_9BIFI|nr:hypothetical protein [Alloscardovia theropitheci]TCD54107.1 hypothetical protein EJ419_05485 [Alloscardovia theropitheci]
MVEVMDAWTLTHEISLRDSVRVYKRAANGRILNDTRDTALTRVQPGTPWALYLAYQGAYQYIVFDLDHHTTDEDNSQTLVDKNLQDITRLLDETHIEYLVCHSSDNGGYHIWIACKDNINATLVRHLALLMHHAYASVDPTPLTNPATGCVRPPYSPHHTSGTSTPISGSIHTLLYPSTTESQIETLLEKVQEKADTITTPVEQPTLNEGSVRLDETGMPYLPGTLRPLSRYIMMLLRTPVTAHTDTSARLYQIILGMVKAHWTYTHTLTYITEHQETDSLIHAFTRKNTDGTRSTRPTTGINSMRLVIARMWKKAVTTIATSHRLYAGHDSEFTCRYQDTIMAIDHLYNWNMNRDITTTGQATDQRVINTLSLWCLKANRLTIQADTRRIALTCGISRQAAANSLHRLIAQHIIDLTTPAHGRIAHTYTIIKNTANTSLEGNTRYNLDTSKYAPTTATLDTIKNILLHNLTTWLTTAAHDACTSHGIGIKPGNKLVTHTMTMSQDDRLEMLDNIADNHQCVGTVRTRAHIYELERLLWAWWHQETTHLTKKHHEKTGRKHARYAHTLTDLLASRYPRKGNQPDYTVARSMLLKLTA